MRYLTLILLVLATTNFISAQTHEIGGFTGGSNFIGDVGATNYISPNQPAFGLIYKWNRSTRHSFRFSAIYTDLEGIDAKSDDSRRKARNYQFSNSIIELSAGIEFTFLDFDLHDDSGEPKSTPYIFSGISFFGYDNYFFDINGVRQDENTSSYSFAVPLVLGYKTTFSDKLIAAIEIGARYTFTDELDGSVPDSKELVNLSFGNINNNDWYVFTGVTLTFTFGKKPCYCYF